MHSITGTNKFKFIDLFAGLGGIRIPFDELGGECTFTSEWDKFAQITYKANFHDEEVWGDISEITANHMEDVGKHDLLLAGFPCQPFSMAGLKLGFQDKRGNMFFEIAKILERYHPKVVFLENVKNFRTHDHGNTFRVVEQTLRTLGYNVFPEVLNAKDFGVPQNRERFYMIGFLDQSIKFEFPKPSGLPTRLGDILEKNVDPKYTISDKLWAGHKRRKEEHKKKGNGFGYSLFNDNSIYTSTISARYYKDGSEILIEQEGKNPRKVTPREAARLQGYPESYKIVVSDNQAYKQFGNSVAVPVIRAIARKIFETGVLGSE